MNLRKMFKLLLTPAAGGRVGLNLMILGLCLGVVGCAAVPPQAGDMTPSRNQANTESERHAEVSAAPSRMHSASALLEGTSPSTQVASGAQAGEHDGQDATTSSEDNAPPRATAVESIAIDPGAAAVALALRQALNEHDGGVSMPEKVLFSRFRNQSRASAEEFASVTKDLRAALTAAAAQQGILCVDDALTPTPYEIEATIYLLREGGGDVWEIFLTLRHRTGAAVWDSDGPVRMLRGEVPENRELIYPTKPRK